MQVGRRPIVIYIEKNVEPEFSGNKLSFGRLNEDTFSSSQPHKSAVAIAIPKPTPLQQWVKWGKEIWQKLSGQ